MPLSKIKLREKFFAALVVFLVVIALTQLLKGGEPVRIAKDAPGIHTLRLAPSTSTTADVTWEASQPAIIEWNGPFDLGTAIVVYLPKNGVYILTSDVIDWDARKRDKTQYVITVGKPDVKPDPKPDPTVPLPTGLAGEIYQLVKPIGESERMKCLQYAANYEVMSTEIAAGALRTLQDIRSRTLQLNQPLQTVPRDARWVSVGTLIQSKIPESASVQSVKEVFDQVVIGLKAAAGGAQ